jgi:hypothetical protein
MATISQELPRLGSRRFEYRVIDTGKDVEATSTHSARKGGKSSE